MRPWLRAYLRQDMPASLALQDAEEHVLELLAELDLARDDEEMDDLHEEIRALRDECKRLTEENERLQQPEAVGALFLSSPAGKAIVKALNDARVEVEALKAKHAPEASD